MQDARTGIRPTADSASGKNTLVGHDSRKETAMPRTSRIVAGVLLAVCASTGAIAQSTGSAFTLTSPLFQDGAMLAQRNSGNLPGNPNCVGSNVQPPLAWTNAPPGTRSFAMIMYDPQGRTGLGVAHWVAYGIAPDVTSLAENEATRPSPKFIGGKGTAGLTTYLGPCPPPNTGLHHYTYTVIATDLEPDALPMGLDMQQLLSRLDGHAKAASSIVLLYGAPRSQPRA
jgi:Raf kinase inhibitor-like YbhB/YbcL family protein